MKTLVIFLAAVAGCGTVGDTGGGARDLPVSGAGPYRRLTAEEAVGDLTAPMVLEELAADLDDPVVLADELPHAEGERVSREATGERLALWVAARRGGRSRIEHADAETLRTGFAPLETAIEADQPWEGDRVGAPSLVRPEGEGPWLLFYQAGDAAGGAIGLATAADGHQWTKAAGPVLVADGAEEGDAIGAPAAVRIGDQVRIYYLARGALWAVEGAYRELAAGRAPAWRRLDGLARTPGRDPMVAGAPYAESLGRPFARLVRATTGRVRHDLYFSARIPAEGIRPASNTIGYAASFSGDDFAVSAKAILAGETSTPPQAASRSPTMTPYGAASLLLFVQRSGSRDAIAGAMAP